MASISNAQAYKIIQTKEKRKRKKEKRICRHTFNKERKYKNKTIKKEDNESYVLGKSKISYLLEVERGLAVNFGESRGSRRIVLRRGDHRQIKRDKREQTRESFRVVENYGYERSQCRHTLLHLEIHSNGFREVIGSLCISTENAFEILPNVLRYNQVDTNLVSPIWMHVSYLHARKMKSMRSGHLLLNFDVTME
ncbi:hypothetical protein V1477_006910 [Vespula maculifrons]|uniref:Uncharacterized protein n=1 Tax=Vespula maculifrons TaxID=7453 RepID=A0ABD2CH14_VESMC